MKALFLAVALEAARNASATAHAAAWKASSDLFAHGHLDTRRFETADVRAEVARKVAWDDYSRLVEQAMDARVSP